MSADPEDVAAVERDKCPDCGLPNGGHLGDCLIGGHQAMEIAALKKRLTEAETLLSDLRFDICTTFNPGNILIKRVKEISIFLIHLTQQTTQITALLAWAQQDQQSDIPVRNKLLFPNLILYHITLCKGEAQTYARHNLSLSQTPITTYHGQN